jgi:predicted nicotinamide N-methyase
MALMDENLVSFERASTSRRQLALARSQYLEDDGVGFAALFVPVLKHALDSWLRAIATSVTKEEEKKEQDATHNDNAACIPTLDETKTLQRVLRVHVAISQMDSTLSEELAREGSHALLQKLIIYDASVWPTEQDRDCIMELQDYCCQVAACTGGAFPLKVSPISVQEMQQRLPLSFHIHPIDGTKSSSPSSPLVLINQVTTRQSAQKDVGFGKQSIQYQLEHTCSCSYFLISLSLFGSVMWPSAVALSRWLVSNPQVIKDCSVLELGAGCGLSGLVAANLKPKSVILTDFNTTVLDNLRGNIVLNNNVQTARAMGLDFYQQCGTASSGWIDICGEAHAPVNVIVAADIICQYEDSVAAAKTIHNALLPDGIAIVICADAKHRFGVESFASECRKLGLTVETTNVLNDLVCEEIEKTTAFVQGMTLTLFQIKHSPIR